jgi:hypothetical protein
MRLQSSLAALVALAAASTVSAQDGPSNTLDLSDSNEQIILVHLIFMVVTWLVLVPAAILIARFGRTYFTWYPHHRNIQLATIAFFIVGFSLGIAAAYPDPLNLQTHYQVGVAIFILFFFQCALGLVAHKVVGRRWLGLIHAPVGLVLFGLAVWNCETGFDIWDYDAGKAPRIVIYAWMGFLVLLYLAGMALLPRQIKQDREYAEKQKLNEKEGGGQPMISTTSTHSGPGAAPPIHDAHLEDGRASNTNSY